MYMTVILVIKDNISLIQRFFYVCLLKFTTATDSNEIPSSSNPCSDVLSAKRYARFDGDTYQTSFSEERGYGNAIVGLMYGDFYTDTHANTNSSAILTNLNK